MAACLNLHYWLLTVQMMSKHFDNFVLSGSGSQDTFSDGDGEDDEDNDDSEPSTGTHEEDDDDEEEDDAESDSMGMEDNGSLGENESLYPFFAMDEGRGRQNTVYVRTGGGPSMSNAYNPRLHGGASLPPGMQWATHQTQSRGPSARTRDFFSSSGGAQSKFV